MTIKPLRGNIFIEPLKKSESEGGILLPETTKEEFLVGMVTAVGAGELAEDFQRRAPCEVHVGDKVLFPKQFAKRCIVINKIKQVAVPISELLAIVED